MKELIKVRLEFSNKVYANLLIGNFFPEKNRVFEVDLHNQTLIYDPLSEYPLKEYSKLDQKIFIDKEAVYNKELPLNRLLREFGDAILVNKKNVNGLELGVNVIKIIEEIEKIIE